MRPIDKKFTQWSLLPSRIFALPFTFLRHTTRWEVTGRERLLEAAEEHQRTGRGLITVSNHVSLFDDPFVHAELLKIENLNEASKYWYSTACAANFNPVGRSFKARMVRLFSDVASMVFLSRAHKRAEGADASNVDEDPAAEVMQRMDERMQRHVGLRVNALGLDFGAYVQRFLTGCAQGTPPERVASFNQAGMIEACMRVDSGDWLHFFPEGGRARDLSLRPARAGVGKILYHVPGARVVPFCIYGTQDILPVGARFPRLGKKVAVSVGAPVDEMALERLRRRPACVETYQAMADLVMGEIAALRPATLAAYLGPGKAARLLADEEAARREHEAEEREARRQGRRPTVETAEEERVAV